MSNKPKSLRWATIKYFIVKHSALVLGTKLMVLDIKAMSGSMSLIQIPLEGEVTVLV